MQSRFCADQIAAFTRWQIRLDWCILRRLVARLAPSRKLVGPYSGALQDYVRQPGQMELRRAGELGLGALLGGLGLPEWSAIHHESVGLCLSLQSLTAKEIAHTMTAASTFFAESMAPFEANRREFRRSNTALRYQNGSWRIRSPGCREWCSTKPCNWWRRRAWRWTGPTASWPPAKVGIWMRCRAFWTGSGSSWRLARAICGRVSSKTLD